MKNKTLSFLLLVGALVLAGCAGSDEATPEEAETTATAEAPATRTVRVETLTLEPVMFQDVVEMTGTVEALDDATLSAQSAGTLTGLKRLGSYVGQGEVIAQIDPGLLRAGVQQAEAAVAAAQAQADLASDTYRRQEVLYADSIISATEFEAIRTQRAQAQASLAQAQAALTQAQEQLRNTTLIAPFGGTVEQHFAENGEQVAPGMPVVRIVNTSRVKVVAGVPERYASEIERGTSVELSFNAYGQGRRDGTVTFVGSVINPSNRTFPVEIEIPNRDRTLKPEMIAKVFVTRAELADRLVVPQTAVIRDENGVTMFVVDRRGGTPRAERRDVALGASYGGRVVVADGLRAGEEVIVVGQTNVTQGDAVEVVANETSSAIATR